MKDPIFVFRTVFFISGLFILITGCGLKYTAPDNLETLEESRREAIEIAYGQAYKKRNKTYKPLTYGELEISKPMSYRKLDSLYERKYALHNLRMSEEEIDSKIDIQKAIVFRDTNPIRYIETHWFELHDSTYEFIIDRISLNRANKILDVDQLDYFQCPESLAVYGRKYMLEGYFTTFFGEVSDQEIEFYTTYKEKASTLQGQQKQDFIMHTLQIMQLANKHSTLSTDILLSKLAQAEILRRDSSALISSMTFKTESIYEEREGKDLFLNYRVTAKTPGSDKAPFVLDYDYYLQPLD